jgi:hypothetical protein
MAASIAEAQRTSQPTFAAANLRTGNDPQARGDRSAKMQRFLDDDIDDPFIAHADSAVRLRAKP